MIEVTGRYETGDGRPATGRIRIRPHGEGWPAPWWLPPDGAAAVTASWVEVPLHDGTATARLRWPSSSGIGAYVIAEHIDGAPPRAWTTPLEDGDRLELLRPR